MKWRFGSQISGQGIETARVIEVLARVSVVCAVWLTEFSLSERFPLDWKLFTPGHLG